MLVIGIVLLYPLCDQIVISSAIVYLTIRFYPEYHFSFLMATNIVNFGTSSAWVSIFMGLSSGSSRGHLGQTTKLSREACLGFLSPKYWSPPWISSPKYWSPQDKMLACREQSVSMSVTTVYGQSQACPDTTAQMGTKNKIPHLKAALQRRGRYFPGIFQISL